MYSIYILLVSLILCSTGLAKSYLPKYKNCGVGPNYQLRSKRVANGVDAVRNSWPSMVNLIFLNKSPIKGVEGEISMCGGTLLDNHHILTAAHCINSTFGDPDVEAYLGLYDRREPQGSVKRDISDYWYIEFDEKSKEDDIAVLRMEKPVKFNNKISPVCLPEEDDLKKDFTNVDVTILGWGLIDENRIETAEILQQAKLQTISNDKCNENLFDGKDRIQSTMICVTSRGARVKFLEGDSGGPLFYQRSPGTPWIQIGIKSFKAQCIPDKRGSRCDNEITYAGVATRLSKYVEWIKDAISTLEKRAERWDR